MLSELIGGINKLLMNKCIWMFFIKSFCCAVCIRCETTHSLPSIVVPKEWQLMPSGPQRWPTILRFCAGASPQREVLILSQLPNQPSHICIKLSQRRMGSGVALEVQETRHNMLPWSAWLIMCLLSPESTSTSTRIDLFKVVNRLIYHQGQKPYWCHPSLAIEKPSE